MGLVACLYLACSGSEISLTSFEVIPLALEGCKMRDDVGPRDALSTFGDLVHLGIECIGLRFSIHIEAILTSLLSYAFIPDSVFVLVKQTVLVCIGGSE